mgnify:CR=1 FL=1
MSAPLPTSEFTSGDAGHSFAASNCSPARFHLDLFSGIGGFALAAQRAGIKTIGFAEIDTYASRTLNKHWPTVPNFGDVRNITADTIREPLFVLTGGFPCQPFSAAGQQAGRDDDRYLWPEMLRIVEALRPTWMLGENVPPLVELALDEVLDGLEAAGYSAQPFIVPACAVGARHRRDRVWIVANDTRVRRDERGAIESVFGMVQTPGGCGLLEPDGSNEASGALLDPWPPEPQVVRVVHGVSKRLDGIKGLGNAIVPEIAFRFFSMMLECERTWL